MTPDERKDIAEHDLREIRWLDAGWVHTTHSGETGGQADKHETPDPGLEHPPLWSDRQ